MDWYGTGKGLVWDSYGMVMGGLWDGYGTVMGRVWDGYGTGKGRVRGGGKEQVREKFSGGWWVVVVVAEIKYSVCPCPFKRPREARRVRDWYGTGKGWAGKGRVRGGGKGQIREEQVLSYIGF